MRGLNAKGNNHVKRAGTFSLNPRLQGREEGPATPMASDLINYVCSGAIPKTQKDEVWRASRLANQNASMCHYAGPRTPQ